MIHVPICKINWPTINENGYDVVSDRFVFDSTNRWYEKKQALLFYTLLTTVSTHAIDSVVFLFLSRIQIFPHYNIHFTPYYYIVSVSVIFTLKIHCSCVPRRCMFARRVCICIPSPHTSFHRGSLHMRFKLRPNNRCRSASYIHHRIRRVYTITTTN